MPSKSSPGAYQLMPVSHHSDDQETLVQSRPDSPDPETHSQEQQQKQQQHGKPTRKRHLEWLDIVSVLVSLLCLACAVVVIDHRLRYAALLLVEGQIIVLGFLLGIMNQCMQCVLPYLFILIECRYRRSTLQNYEGLLRWSPWVGRLSFVWRSIIILLTALPLALSVLYKRSIGGSTNVSFEWKNPPMGPTGPPGMQTNVGPNQIMANATAPFMSATDDSIPFHVDKPLAGFNWTPGYGFNVVLLSNESAAALDAPSPARVQELQRMLPPGSYTRTWTNTRATVATYNSFVGDEQSWNNSYPSGIKISLLSTVDDYYFGLGHAGVGTITDSIGAGNDNNNSNSTIDPRSWNTSWILVGGFSTGTNTNDNLAMRNSFFQTAFRFDIARHYCRAIWRITPGSVALEAGNCADRPLGAEHQFYDDARIPLVSVLGQSIADNLAPFLTTRSNSQWKIPTHAVILASAYQAFIAARRGVVERWNATASIPYSYHESYNGSEEGRTTVPTLKRSFVLYLVIVIQPILTVLAFCAIILLYDTPVGRRFGLVAILAGADRQSLDQLTGASFSGQLDASVGLQVVVLSDAQASEVDGKHGHGRVEYRVGRHGAAGRVQRRKKYE